MPVDTTFPAGRDGPIFKDGRLIGHLINADRHGWFVQFPGETGATAPRWGMTRREALLYLLDEHAKRTEHNER